LRLGVEFFISGSRPCLGVRIWGRRAYLLVSGWSSSGTVRRYLPPLLTPCVLATFFRFDVAVPGFLGACSPTGLFVFSVAAVSTAELFDDFLREPHDVAVRYSFSSSLDLCLESIPISQR